MIPMLLATAFAGSPLTIGDPDGVSLKPGLLLDVRGTSTLTDEPSFALGLQRVRPNIRGTCTFLGPKVRYFVQAEFAGNPAILDAVVQMQATPWLEVAVGRFLVPFSRAWLTPVPKLQFHGFTPSTTDEGHGRDVGVQLKANPTDRLDLRAAIFQGPGDAEVPRPLAIGRVQVDVLGHMPFDETLCITEPDSPIAVSIGAGGQAGSDIRPRDQEVLQTRAGSLDMAMRLGHVRVQSEFFARSWSDGENDLGGYLQASVAPVHTLEVAGRFDVHRTMQEQWTAQGAINWYPLGDNLRTSLEYTWLRPDTKADTDAIQRVAVQQQLWF